jgi:hypothetical protein
MADDARQCAATLKTSELKDQLLMLAERCERMAERSKWRQIADQGMTARYPSGNQPTNFRFDPAQTTPQNTPYNLPS